jgi:hypothetical protein
MFMEIKIDTQKDSTEDIKKAIKFLQEFVNQDSYTSNQSYSNTSSQTPSFSLFDDDDSDKKEYEEEKPSKPPRVEIVEW